MEKSTFGLGKPIDWQPKAALLLLNLDRTMKPLIYLTVFILISGWAWGSNQVPECKSQPDYLSHGKVLSSVKSLPRMVYIAKRAIHFIEGKDNGFRLWGEQSFVRGQSRIVCASNAGLNNQSFSLYAPTLIDLSGEKSNAESYWQFHMISNPEQFGIWNKKSSIFSQTKDLEAGLKKIGAQVQIIQISRDEYEFQFSRETNKTFEILSIRFDAVPDIP
jgi:hypothetical protein